MIEIQTVFTPKLKQKRFMREGGENGKVSRISQDKWWKLYDKGAKILQPVYEIDPVREEGMKKIAEAIKQF